MATIDSLRFDVILNDAAFTKAINADIALANKLNTSLSTILNMRARVIVSETGVKNAQQMSMYLSQISQKIASMPKGNFLIGDADRLNATLAETNKRLDQIIAKSQKARQGVGNAGGGFLREWLRFSATLWSIIGIVRIFTRTFGKAIKNMSDFQQANANLATIMQVSRERIEVLTNDALMLGRTTEWTASQVTELQTALAKLGYNIPQIRNMQASVLQFATSVGAKLPEAANLAGAALRMFGMRSSEMQKALEVLTASTNKTALDFEKLKVSLPYVGAIAHSIGFDIAQTASLLGVLTNAGLESSRAGTGLRQVLLELSKTNGKLQTAMGGNIKSFDDFVNGLQAMRDRGLEAGEATKLVSTRASAALLILANGVDDIRRLNDEVRDTDGLLKNIQKERLNTLHGSTLLLKSAWEGLIQTFRESTGPMKDIVDWLTKIVRATSLAASRANRVAQGTKNVIGSDTLTTQFKDDYESLLARKISPEDAQILIQSRMQQWLSEAYGDYSDLRKKGYKENGWTQYLYSNPLTHWLVSGKINKGRAANEQIEAIENAIDSVNDYMTNRSQEEAEIAAHAYLERWKAIFNAEGEDAARAAMNSVAGSELIDKMKDQMVAYMENGGEEGAKERGKGKTPKEKEQEAISDLRREANYLRKLFDDYERLEQYLGEEGAGKKLGEILGGGEYTKGGIEEGILAITSALRGMGEEGADAADEIERSWGLDKVSRATKQLESDKKAAEKAEKALKDYETVLKKFDKDWGGGESRGAAYDIERAVRAFNDEDKTIDREYLEAQRAAKKAHEGNADAIKEELDKLEKLYVARKKANKNKLTETVRDKANAIFKEQMQGFDLTNFGRKTLSQINAIREAINNIEVPDEIRDELGWNTEAVEALIEALRKLKEDTLKNTVDPEMFKKVSKEAKRIAGYLGTAAEKMRALAEATGNTGLADAAEIVGMLAQNMQAAADGAEAWGGWWGAIIGGATDLISQISDGLTGAVSASKELAKTVREIATDSLIASNTALFSNDGIFGEHNLKNVRGAVEAMRNLRENMVSLGDPKVKRSMSFWDKVSLGWRLLLNKDHIAPEEFAVQGKLTDTMAKYGLNVYDKYGNLDPASIREIINLFGDEDGVLEQLAKDAEAYAEAMKVVEEVAESIVGDVVSDVADKIVDSWWEAGQAALDYADILGDVAKSYAKLIVQDMLLDAAFDGPKRQAFIDALKSGDASTAMAVVEQAMMSAQSMLPTIQSALEAFEPYRQLASESSSSNSVGNGLKSMTEDTANLLASYINAIRADVSFMRDMQEKGWNGFGNMLPTLNDHLAKIEATNFDISQSTQSILMELRSVIGAPGTSGMVVRIEQA